ncbi:uncharacterized protein METZ01_LOCUS229484 [marine metagenome]|uniref:MAPEG family protein n=1 Tax=marine metagenome TaxID=408172 RepID=A0A382GNA2_9ZZZZ
MTFAYVCIVIALILPIILAGIAKKESEVQINNNDPRDYVRNLKGRAKYAYGAEQNSYESFPPFAIAVIVAHLTGGTQLTIDFLAGLYIFSRLMYIVFYLQGKGTLRSATYMVGLISTIALFFVS